MKTIKFRKPTYVGDVLNACKIFNEKEVDELIVLDITATAGRRDPAWTLIEEIASECFMPVCYGGGIRTCDQMARLLRLGIEKVSISSAALEDRNLVRAAAERFGSQSVVVCLDVKRTIAGRYQVVTHNGRRKTGLDPAREAVAMQEAGAGELLINSVTRDGTMAGYDIDLVSRVAAAVDVPVIACGGAGSMHDIKTVIAKAGASAAAAGSLFVFQGRHRAVLINYPSGVDLTPVDLHPSDTI